MGETDMLDEKGCSSRPTENNVGDGSSSGAISAMIGDDRTSEDSFHRTIRKARHEGEEKKADPSPIDLSSSIEEAIKAISSDTLEQKTNQIIHEAQLETLKKRGFEAETSHQPMGSLSRQDALQEALDRAAATGRAAAAEAISIGAGVTQSVFGNELDGDTSDLSTVPRVRLDVEALERPARQEDHAQSKPNPSPLEARSEPHCLPPQSLAGRPPLSPTTPSSDFARSAGLMQRPSPISTTQREEGPAPYLSPTDSVGSIDDDEIAMKRLPHKIVRQGVAVPKEKMLRRIDGIVTSPGSDATVVAPPAPDTAHSYQYIEEDGHVTSVSGITTLNDQETDKKTGEQVKKVKTVVIKSIEPEMPPEVSLYESWLNFFLGGTSTQSEVIEARNTSTNGNGFGEIGEIIGPMACGSQPIPFHDDLPAMATSLVRVASRENGDGYAEAINAHEKFIDPRMPEWVDNQFSVRDQLPKDGTYQLGESRTVIVHELIRGSWTWCIDWSPDGRRLAIGTENHHLAIVDTYSSAIWRIKHDKRVSETASRVGDTQHSIRSIAWGMQFIAVGGIGNSVSILATTEPYPILHTITPTGFVGSLDWLLDTNTLVIGSRNGKAMIVKVWANEKNSFSHVMNIHKEVESTIVHTIDRQQAWVNSARFSPGGRACAVGDSEGILGVYSYEEKPGTPLKITNIANFKLEDSILDVEWSPDGHWLYAGGEDFVVTVINTQGWEAVHRIKRDRWVQFISASNGGSHVAIGGMSSELSILDVDRGWDTAINISLKGLVALSAKWHPQDQYLVLTGQNNSILAVETTNARYVSGHLLRSSSPILAIEFSPDGRMVAVGNEAGVVTIFKLSGTTFTTAYELVLDGDESLSIKWSLNGAYLVIAAGSKVVIVARSSSLPRNSPPNTSGFHVTKVIRDSELVNDVAISPRSRYVAISSRSKTRILDVAANFKCILETKTNGTTLANSWSPDGKWFATIGQNQGLLVFDTSSENPTEWKMIFTVETKQPGLALAWGPAMNGGLQYCAYGGEDKKVYIMEIRTKERTWETVLGIRRADVINDLDWNPEGLVAAAVGNGTVTVLDLSYLQSGWAVNEMDYNWQRQALTCCTEIRRNKGKHSMKCVRWIPSAPGSDSLLAVGGTDGEVEIVDLTDRQRCSGFSGSGT